MLPLSKRPRTWQVASAEYAHKRLSNGILALSRVECVGPVPHQSRSARNVFSPLSPDGRRTTPHELPSGERVRGVSGITTRSVFAPSPPNCSRHVSLNVGSLIARTIRWRGGPTAGTFRAEFDWVGTGPTGTTPQDASSKHVKSCSPSRGRECDRPIRRAG